MKSCLQGESKRALCTLCGIAFYWCPLNPSSFCAIPCKSLLQRVPQFSKADFVFQGRWIEAGSLGAEVGKLACTGFLVFMCLRIHTTKYWARWSRDCPSMRLTELIATGNRLAEGRHLPLPTCLHCSSFSFLDRKRKREQKRKEWWARDILACHSPFPHTSTPSPFPIQGV